MTTIIIIIIITIITQIYIITKLVVLALSYCDSF